MKLINCLGHLQTQHQLQKKKKKKRLISVDGNFRLVRKKSAGKSPQPGHHEGRMFLPDLPPLQSQSENVEAGTVQVTVCKITGRPVARGDL